jgi:HlyD family secretion protein
MTGTRLLGLVSLVLAILVAWLLLPTPDRVQVVTVQRKDAVQALAVNGRIRPRLSVDVQSPVAGTILELPFDVGDRVGSGTVIARVDDGPQRAAIREAEAAIAAQEAIVAQARRDLARFQALGEFVTRQRVEQARLAVVQGTRELQRLRESRTQAQEVQQRYVIHAPFSGVILERPVDRGQTIGPDTILYRLADLTAPEVTAEVDEAYAARLRGGTIGLVEVVGQNRPLRASVVHIEPRVDETTGAREVRLDFLHSVDFVPAGQTVSVNLIVERRPNAISIPRAAILAPESNPHVRFIDSDGRVAERAVKFIDWPAAQVIVTSGLEPGMRVLAEPRTAEPGERVKAAD